MRSLISNVEALQHKFALSAAARTAHLDVRKAPTHLRTGVPSQGSGQRDRGGPREHLHHLQNIFIPSGETLALVRSPRRRAGASQACHSLSAFEMFRFSL